MKHRILNQENDLMMDVLKITLIISICTLFCHFINYRSYPEVNNAGVYTLGVVALSLWTNGIMPSLIYATVSVVVYDFYFINPRGSFHFEPVYVLTLVMVFLVVTVIAVVVSRLKREMIERVKVEENAKHESQRANLLRSMSHDIRTPLTGIYGCANLLLEGEDKLSKEKRHELYCQVADEAKWLQEIIENLLTITKVNDVDNGNLNLRTEPEELYDIIEVALQHSDSRLKEHSIKLDCDDTILVSIDAHLIAQVILNLVNNAVKYTEVGSTISISVREEGSRAIVSVADTGKGISDEDKEKIFDRFYITDRGSDDRRGHGLGLAVCKSAIEAHGGHIIIRDNLPRGTVFEFDLPLVEVGYE